MWAGLSADALLNSCIPAMRELPQIRAVFGIVQLCRQENQGAVYPRGRGDHPPLALALDIAIFQVL
jgi:hypothetical protein